MKLSCLGGAGGICREAALDLMLHGGVNCMTIADANRQAAKEVAKWLDDTRVDAVEADVRDTEATVALMAQRFLRCSPSATSASTNGRSSSI